jgi:hypothetical protein
MRLRPIPDSNLNSVVEPEPHHFGGSGAVTRYGSGSDGSKVMLSLNSFQKMAQTE